MVEPETYSPAARTAPLATAVANILLVDDEPRNLEVLETILEAPDRRLIRARSTEETLLALVQHDFTVIVLDVQMPGLTGLELAQVIKQRKRTRHIPIIFLTAYYQDQKDVLSGYDVGAVDYLTKPVDPRILRSKINVFVELFRIQRALLAANGALEQEIAERKVAQLAMSRLAAIVEGSSDAILGRTLGGTVTTWNRGAERLLGYTAAEMVGQPFSVLVPPERPDETEQLVERLQRGEIVEAIETVRMCKDGCRVDVSLNASPIKDAAGLLTGVSVIMRDITERRRLEAEVLEATEGEQRRIAQDLHDGLGQELAGISCLSNMLKHDLEAESSAHAAVAAKISALLDLAVAESRALAQGLHPIAPEPNGLMSALENLAVATTELFQVACRFECLRPVLVEDYGVATNLYRIAQEAVTNAIKHGRARRIEIGLASTPGRIELTVNSNEMILERMQKQTQKGIGLRIMSYRARSIGGSLAFVRNEAGGIDLICTVPTTGEHDANE
ncbi:MAG TPA: PAS domain S-box protein [Verrucomicrobiae bacterium]|nr:PAS domain S-box protein [Verrucomicrobiae bacterium]